MCKRFLLSRLTLSLAFTLCGMQFVRLASAQSFERLPACYSVAQLERLRRIHDEIPLDDPQLDARDVVRFAGGSLALQLPPGWWADEVPYGREVRLVIAPERPGNVRRMPSDGMWLAYHPVAPSDPRNDEELTRVLSGRLRATARSDEQYSAPTSFRLGDWPAAVAEFTSSEASPNRARQGRHVLVRTDWGDYEFHASAPLAVVESRSRLWSVTWDSLRLSPPGATNVSGQMGTHQSNGIIGDWKSYRSRMRFSTDGGIVIFPDATSNHRSSSPLTGTFETRDDLIFILWDDGSRLNFRWRLQGNDLFLTDHEGQTSQLKRVFN